MKKDIHMKKKEKKMNMEYLRDWPYWEIFLRLRRRAGRDFSISTCRLFKRAFYFFLKKKKRRGQKENLAINAHNIEEETRQLISLFP